MTDVPIAKNYAVPLLDQPSNNAQAIIYPNDLETALAQATFLLDRLESFEASFDGTPDEIYREFAGHVTPAMSRLSVIRGSEG